LPGDWYVVSLGDIAERLDALVMTCDRCHRRDRYSLWKLIAKYGADAPIEPLRQEIIAGCPEKANPNGCAPYCPDLSKVF
jgi:hypothetical protein